MSDSQPPAGADRPGEDKASSSSAATPVSGSTANGAGTSSSNPADTKDASMEVEEDEWPEDIKNASPEDLMTRVRMLDNDIRVSPAYSQDAELRRRLGLNVSDTR